MVRVPIGPTLLTPSIAGDVVHSKKTKRDHIPENSATKPEEEKLWVKRRNFFQIF